MSNKHLNGFEIVLSPCNYSFLFTWVCFVKYPQFFKQRSQIWLYCLLFLLSVYVWWAFTGNCNNIKAIPILLYFPCYFIGNKFSVQSISFKEQFRFMIWPFLEIVFLDFSLSFGCISLFRILLSPFHGPSNTNHSILIRIRSFYDNSLFNYIDRNKCLYHPWYNEKLVIRLKMIGQ